MKVLPILTMAALPLMAGGWDDNHRWKVDEKESIRRTFDTAAGARKLEVNNLFGFIHVTGYGGSQVQVSVEKHIYAESSEAMAEAKRDVKLDMSQQGNFVRLHYDDGPSRTGHGTRSRDGKPRQVPRRLRSRRAGSVRHGTCAARPQRHHTRE